MKSKIHIATKEYCFIEVEHEVPSNNEELEAIIDVHDKLALLINDKEGLSASAWKKVRTTMLNTGEFDPNLSEELSKAQRYWINQTKLGLRDIKNNNENHE